jgi:hypothetical protein
MASVCTSPDLAIVKVKAAMFLHNVGKNTPSYAV